MKRGGKSGTSAWPVVFSSAKTDSEQAQHRIVERMVKTTAETKSMYFLRRILADEIQND
jgi:hypothetical protein